MEVKITLEQSTKLTVLLTFLQEHPASGITTMEQLLERVVEQGVYQVDYRSRRNVREYANFKAWKKTTS